MLSCLLVAARFTPDLFRAAKHCPLESLATMAYRDPRVVVFGLRICAAAIQISPNPHFRLVASFFIVE